MWRGPEPPADTVEQNKTVKCAQRQASKYSAELRWAGAPLAGCVDRPPAGSGPAGHRKQGETGASQLTAPHLTRCLGSAPQPQLWVQPKLLLLLSRFFF